MFGWFKRFRLRGLINRAFFAADRGDYEEAMGLLEQALKIDPNNGHANNEMGFCLTRTGQPERAMLFARKAVVCEPNNPKFWNSLLGVQFEFIKRLQTKKAVAEAARGMMEDVERLIRGCPDYAPAYLAKANVLAMSGAPREQWEAALTKSAEAYERTSRMASGLRATGSRMEQVMSEQIQGCLALARHWAGLSETQGVKG